MPLIITDTDIDLELFMNNLSLEDSTKERIRNGRIIILPEKVGENYTIYNDTLNLKKYINMTQKDLNVQICMDTKKITTYHLHSGDLWFSTLYFISTEIGLPLIIGIISSYIYDKLKKLKGEAQTIHIKIVIKDKKKNKTKMFSFDGPSEDIKDTFKKIDLNTIFK